MPEVLEPFSEGIRG